MVHYQPITEGNPAAYVSFYQIITELVQSTQMKRNTHALPGYHEA